MTGSTGESRERANAAGTDNANDQVNGEAADGGDYAIPGDTFSLRLVVARHHAGRLSIEQAAKRCGLNSGNWQRWEDGARPRDLIEVCQSVSEGLMIDFDWLMFGGPLLGSRGRPTRRQPKGPIGDTRRYPQSPVRRGSAGPKVRTDRRGPISLAVAGRRANRVYPNPLAAASAEPPYAA